MSLEQRYYTTSTAPHPRVPDTLVPAITLEPMLDGTTNPRTGLRSTVATFSTGKMSDGSDYVVVASTPEGWARFDELYPNQDSDSGTPYLRRFPQKNLADVDFSG